MTYVCSSINEFGNCLAWVEQSTSILNNIDAQAAFASGFAIVFTSWGVGFTVAVVLKTIRQITV